MPWGYAAAAFGSAAIGAYSANQAAGAQQAASNASVAEQRRQFNAMMERSQPFNQAAVTGLNSLLAMEGLPMVSAPNAQSQNPTSADIYQNTPVSLRNFEVSAPGVMHPTGRPSITSSFLSE